tara:strand:+ start:298 stop:570 length:273 start_codon:yes stop_codon:yes gene_type:complete
MTDNPDGRRWWRKKTWINCDILITDEFFCKTPDLDEARNYPPSAKATFKVIGESNKRTTIEELDLEMEKKLDEEVLKKGFGVVEEKPPET